MERENKSTKKKTAPLEQKKYDTTILKNSRFLFSILLIIVGISLTLSFVSYFITGIEDQSNLIDVGNRELEVNNWLGKLGAYLGHVFIYQGFGLASFFFAKLLVHTGVYAFFGIASKRIKKVIFWDLTSMVLLGAFLGFFWKSNPLLGGTVGYEINLYLTDYLGTAGTILLISFITLTFFLFRYKLSPTRIRDFIAAMPEKFAKISPASKLDDASFDKEIPSTPVVNQATVKVETEDQKEPIASVEDKVVKAIQPEEEIREKEVQPSAFSIDHKSIKPTIGHSSELNLPLKKEGAEHKKEEGFKPISTEEFVIEAPKDEGTVEENLAAQLVQDFGEFDPTLELSNYQFPSIDLLKDYGTGSITINQEELEENKNNIVETLRNYKIDIAQIKATVGPTVTLYEIVPEAGVRISKIKNLEDDIALSLAALGIRIIAPIPGKGTIGIEVPNTSPSTVSMRSVIGSPKFQSAEMELPVALGKTISNETFVVDLAKMPHLLMAGATGQGKSVGLNALLTSLLYKKHPAEVKFVLVDPKKVELTLFNKIERHYLAKLPDSEEAIITDNTKVINTLNSLCIEMDNRYSLLKDAMVRNIKEYNEKFKQRRLNPENGHRFLPYIVLVIDEFADLIMTAGKDVETPIARLAQLARAIGIHLIIATQRPSVNVITGIIKANFPARIAFRVTSKIDSRTILDQQGADQLIGRGDLLYTQGNDLVRVQCAFVDTPEVEKITEYIGGQKAYPDAYLLPEYVGEEGSLSALDMDISERDSLFREAAEIIVTAQQGSASLLQRKLKLGYNRAGRIIDQLEAAGIVGPFEGSKARSVLIPDLVALDHFFQEEQNDLFN
ncbi:DNA translocase FtsK 4TM domain-containing protein [Myroides sp. 1354]|uniref:FtsK/SpoIIIE family DNA translocase n=1 Tax=unclassified Myroides TaxID=2642485 RepID=UPI0025759906|nr:MULTISPECIES: DNA translocase FtsK [unclassified Myroides]MDM1046366.1 DNA translocase FtsK 4TM domain-containing protein [Myroides sp. R163-1]MDM1057303.1 DNA translocase FtsK 4TM domain-containing protein [Myroides sp. 1354]MDM1070462.1 DNA translocase FtsK 4TM domain-containing protein [Myroides sp. 1372]